MNYSYIMLVKYRDIAAIGRFIKRRRIKKGLTAKQLASAVGISDSHIIYIEKGRRKAGFDKIVNILEALGASVEDLLYELSTGGSNLEPATFVRRLYRIPVITLVKAGKWNEVCDSFEPGDADEWIESDVRGKSVFALRVAGDSMEPEFKEGEVIIVNPHIESLPNDYVVVKNKNNEATFKQLKKFGPRWVLHPLNPKYDDMEVKKGELYIVGKVVKKEKKY